MKYLNYDGVVKYTTLLKGLIGSEVNAASSALNDAITSGLADFTDALIFLNLIKNKNAEDSTVAVDLTTDNDDGGVAYNNAKKGAVYIVAPTLPLKTVRVKYVGTDGSSAVDYLEAGDTLICINPAEGTNKAQWGVLQTNLQVTNNSATLSGTTATSIATVAGVPITVKLSKSLGNAAACGVATTVANNGSLVTGSAISSAIANASSALNADITETSSAVNTLMSTTFNGNDSEAGISVALSGQLAPMGPTLTITTDPGSIAASSETSKKPNNFVTGAAVYDYVESKVDTADTATAAANGVSVGLTGKVSNHGLIVGVTGGTIGATDNSVVLGSTVYNYNWGGSKTSSYAGVEVKLGGSVGSPTISVEVGSNAAIAGSTTGHAKDVVLGYQVYNYVENLSMPIESVEAAYSAGINGTGGTND